MAYVFGKNDESGTGFHNYSADTLVGCRFTCGENNTIRSMYMYGIIDVAEDARLALYDVSGNLLGYTDPLPDATGWSGADMVSAVVVTSSANYYLSLHVGDEIGLVGNTSDLNDIMDASGQTWASGAPDPFPADEDIVGDGTLNIYADSAWINPPAVDSSAGMLLTL